MPSASPRLNGSRPAAQRARETVPATPEAPRSFGDFLCCVVKAGSDQGNKIAEGKGRLREVYKTLLTVSQGGNSGGYLVPVDFSRAILQTVEDLSVFRKRGALVIPMKSAETQCPLPDAETVQSAGTAPFFGGFLLSWATEGSTRAESEPKWRNVTLRANDLTGYCNVGNAMLEDAGAPFEAFLKQLFGKAVDYYQDYAFFQGDGVGQPLGIINGAGAIKVARANANHFNSTDASAMLAKFLPRRLGYACWAMSPSAIQDASKILDGNQQFTWTPAGSDINEGNVVARLAGRPVIETSKLPALGTLGDVVLFDPQLYAIGDRMEIEVAASAHVNFLTNQTIFRVVSRADGQPFFGKTITLPDAAQMQCSPYVVLQ